MKAPSQTSIRFHLYQKGAARKEGYAYAHGYIELKSELERCLLLDEIRISFHKNEDEGNPTDRCRNLQQKIQDLIEEEYSFLCYS